jgi:ubiquinone/menaquinone biosynthesis C-methylase UbiE/uncharacterized protein YbaR (Trm112 family)
VELLEIIKCTQCKGDLEQNEDYLVCSQCNIRYPIVDGIPVMRRSAKPMEGEGEYENMEFARKFDTVRLGKKYERGRKGLIDTISEMAQIENNTKVLSVGAGTGLYEQHLSPDNTVALDYSLAMLKIAREKGIKNLICADARELPFPEGTFDCVLLIYCGSLHHSKEDGISTIKEMKRVAKKEGRLIVVLPNQIFNIMVGALLHANPRYNTFGVYPGYIKQLFQQQGIEVVDNRTFLTLDPERKLRRALDRLLHKLRINCFGATIITHGRI